MSVTGTSVTTTYDWRVAGISAPPRRPMFRPYRQLRLHRHRHQHRRRGQRRTAAITITLAPPVVEAGSISGTLRIGETLSLSGMSVTGTSVTTTYDWKVDGITRATTATYVPAHTGSCVCTVTGTNTGGAISDSTAAVTIGPALPVVEAGSISGTPQVGQTLSLSGMSVTGTGVTTTYAWKMDGVTQGTSATFVPAATGSCVCTVTGTNSSGASATAPRRSPSPRRAASSPRRSRPAFPRRQAGPTRSQARWSATSFSTWSTMARDHVIPTGYTRSAPVRLVDAGALDRPRRFGEEGDRQRRGAPSAAGGGRNLAVLVRGLDPDWLTSTTGKYVYNGTLQSGLLIPAHHPDPVGADPRVLQAAQTATIPLNGLGITESLSAARLERSRAGITAATAAYAGGTMGTIAATAPATPPS